MIYHDYKCLSCGQDYRDVECASGDAVPRERPWSCECGGRVVLNLGSRLRSWLNIHASGRGRLYGRFDPQFGCVVEDYSHRKRLLRAMGAEDAGDPVRGVRADLDAMTVGGTGKGMPEGVIAAESIEELEQLTDGAVQRKDQDRFRDIGLNG